MQGDPAVLTALNDVLTGELLETQLNLFRTLGATDYLAQQIETSS